jgi:hypothetical protein
MSERPSQSRAALEDLADAFEKYGHEETALLFRKSAVSIAGLVEGDYDVLIARKVRAVSELLNSDGGVDSEGNLSGPVGNAMRELLGEVREAFNDDEENPF